MTPECCEPVLSSASVHALSHHIYDWVYLARQLGLHDDDIQSIACSRKERSECCYEAMVMSMTKGRGIKDHFTGLLSESALSDFVKTGDVSMFVK